MSYMSDWIYSDEDMEDALKKERTRIHNEIKQAVENGLIKIESGAEKLFEILS